MIERRLILRRISLPCLLKLTASPAAVPYWPFGIFGHLRMVVARGYRMLSYPGCPSIEAASYQTSAPIFAAGSVTSKATFRRTEKPRYPDRFALVRSQKTADWVGALWAPMATPCRRSRGFAFPRREPSCKAAEQSGQWCHGAGAEDPLVEERFPETNGCLHGVLQHDGSPQR